MMKLLLVTNAIDSLNWALKHFNNFFKKDPYFENREASATDLKQAIINLNSCLELLFKKFISDSNEALIYDIENSNAAILEFYRIKACGNTELTMYDYFVINNKNIRTISYSKCIDCFCEIFEVGAAYSKAFKNINDLRNTIMHLGIDYKQQYYILVEHIDKILWFIQYELLPKLELDQKSHDKIEVSILGVESLFAEIGDTLWKQLYKKQIDSIADKLEDAFNSSEVQSYLTTQKRKIEFYATNDMEHSSARMVVKDDGIDEEILSAYHDPLTKSLIINDGQNDALVFAAISLTAQGNTPSKFYCCKDFEGVIVEKIDDQSDFWTRPEYANKFYYMDYNQGNLISLMKKMIDYGNALEFVEA